MGKNDGTGGDPDLFTVLEFAERHRVDISVVRGWIKRGQIPYVLEGVRKMRRVWAPGAVRPVVPSRLSPELLHDREQLISYLIVYSGIEEPVAREIATGLDDVEVESQMREFVGAQLTGGANG